MNRIDKIKKIATDSGIFDNRSDIDYFSIKESAKKKRKKKKNKSKKRTPTKPDLWAKAKRKAREKFEVYPSAYANGWAAKWYKEKGGGWRGPKPKK